jgi:hypothetical protein
VTRLTNASDAAPYFVSPGVPTERQYQINYNGALYQANDFGKITQGDPATDLCFLPDLYKPVSEGGADGIAADATYAYGLFNDGNQKNPVLIRCRRNSGPSQTPEVLFPPAPGGSATNFGAFGGIKDTGDALYWGARATSGGSIVVFRLVR